MAALLSNACKGAPSHLTTLCAAPGKYHSGTTHFLGQQSGLFNGSSGPPHHQDSATTATPKIATTLMALMLQQRGTIHTVNIVNQLNMQAAKAKGTTPTHTAIHACVSTMGRLGDIQLQPLDGPDVPCRPVQRTMKVRASRCAEVALWLPLPPPENLTAS